MSKSQVSKPRLIMTNSIKTRQHVTIYLQRKHHILCHGHSCNQAIDVYHLSTHKLFFNIETDQHLVCWILSRVNKMHHILWYDPCYVHELNFSFPFIAIFRSSSNLATLFTFSFKFINNSFFSYMWLLHPVFKYHVLSKLGSFTLYPSNIVFSLIWKGKTYKSMKEKYK